ncbi:MAG: TRAP transporter substrate-binding protein [Hyphomicrobiales bacterium]|nr:TRAP transporter substrate-binding protein [Hyphomicrobiales bacterium]
MKIVAAAIAALLVTVLPATSVPASAQDKPVTLKLSHWVPPSHPLQKAIQDWAEDVKRASGGTINYLVFPSEQLGKAFDHYDMARDGIADLAYVNPGYQPGRFPVIAAGELPFMISDAHTGSAALDAWYRPYAAQEMKDVHYCFAFVHDPSGIHARKKILLPSDISGMKVRPANATIGAFVVSLGGTNVQASAPESRDALERGVADAITFPWGSLVLFGIDKVVKYHMDAPLYVSDFVWVMNKKTYDDMSPSQKKVIDDHCTTEWAQRFASPWADFEHAGRDKVKAETGHDVYQLTNEEVAQWRKAAEPLKAKWAEGVKKTGADPEKAFADFTTTLEKYKAGY